MVYFINELGTEMYKIGFSKNNDPQIRLAQLQTGSSKTLVVVDYDTSLTRQDENALHARYSHIRKRGEWFDFTGISKNIFSGFDNAMNQKYIDKCNTVYFPPKGTPKTFNGKIVPQVSQKKSIWQRMFR